MIIDTLLYTFREPWVGLDPGGGGVKALGGLKSCGGWSLGGGGLEPFGPLSKRERASKGASKIAQRAFEEAGRASERAGRDFYRAGRASEAAGRVSGAVGRPQGEEWDGGPRAFLHM